MNSQIKKISLETIKDTVSTVFQLDSTYFDLTPSSIALACGRKANLAWKTVAYWQEIEYGRKDILEEELFNTLFQKQPKSEPLIIITDETYKKGFWYLINYSGIVHFAKVTYPNLHQAEFVQPLDIIFFSPEDKLLTLLHHEGKYLQIDGDSKETVNFPSIVCTKEVLQGSPRLSGRRLAVGDIVSLVSSYGTFEEVKRDFELNASLIKEALLYCSNQQCIKDKPLVYCHNCILRTEKESLPDLFDLEEKQIDDTKIVIEGTSIYFGSKEEYLKDVQGERWWEVASDLLIDLEMN